MTPYDWLLIFVGFGLIVLFTFERMVRALFSLVALWSATLLAAVLYREVTFRVQVIAGRNPILARGIVFDILLVVFLVAGYVVIRLAFPVTKLPRLGILDNVMGLALGVLIAVIFVSLLVNSMGVMVIDRWEVNEEGWAALRTATLRSQLRPYTSQVLAAYSWAFVPFFRGLPPVLIPQ